MLRPAAPGLPDGVGGEVVLTVALPPAAVVGAAEVVPAAVVVGAAEDTEVVATVVWVSVTVVAGTEDEAGAEELATVLGAEVPEGMVRVTPAEAQRAWAWATVSANSEGEQAL